jgi:hypothetical protein
VSAAPSTPAVPDPAASWPGRYVRYDLVKELVVALAAIAALTVVLTILFSSPDLPPTTIQSWSRADPGDFVAVAIGELDRSSEIATYGPPYNHTPGAAQEIGPIHLQQWAGVHIPIDTAREFVLDPLRSIPGDLRLKSALAAYEAAPPSLRKSWTTAYESALEGAHFPRSATPHFPGGSAVALPAGSYGPVPKLMAALLGLAQSGGLDGALVAGDHRFYETNYVRPLLFLSGGEYFEARAEGQHLLGTQWGMMNETGSYPGQVWLWLSALWYQIEPFKSSENADALVLALMGLLSLAFVCIPFIPGLRTLPRHLRLYRAIWRDHYREVEG